MRSKLVKIGTSRGIRIPKALLEEAELTDEVEMRVVDGELCIAPVEPPTGGVFLQLSESALGDWARPEENEAWAHLQ